MTNNDQWSHDVCILGAGRVGLPLGLSLMESGLSAVGVDIDPALRESVNSGRMPFHEPGYDDLVASRKFVFYDTPDIIGESRAIVITVGTPLRGHIEADLSQIDLNIVSGSLLGAEEGGVYLSSFFGFDIDAGGRTVLL